MLRVFGDLSFLKQLKPRFEPILAVYKASEAAVLRTWNSFTERFVKAAIIKQPIPINKPIKSTHKPKSKLEKRFKVISKRMTRSKSKLTKLARKKNKQFQKSQKKISKKLVKSRTKVVRSIRKNNKQFHAYLRGNSKELRKLTRKILKPLRKLNKKFQNRLSTISRKFIKTGVYQVPLLLSSVLIAGGLGVLYGHQIWIKGYANALGENSRQIVQGPSKVSAAGPAQNNSLFSMYPTWSQNFATESLNQPDLQYWNIFKGAAQNDNHEAQYYTDDPTNLHIKDGVLSLVATHQSEPEGYNYASARIDTENKLSFLYGRIDVTAKLPKGVGTWPAAWFLPANTKYRDLSPPSDTLRYVNGGEMDLIEAVGFNPNIEYGVVHTRSDLKNPNRVGAYNQVKVPGNDAAYNTYSLLWTPTSITFAVNNTPFFTYDKPAGADYTTWAFDQPFYMIINLAMGGSWGGEDIADFPGNGIDDSALPASMDIKSIYYYPYLNPR